MLLLLFVTLSLQLLLQLLSTYLCHPVPANVSLRLVRIVLLFSLSVHPSFMGRGTA